MKKALLVCVDRYPNGDAGAVRTHSFAKLLKQIGYTPTVVGLGDTTEFKYRTDETGTISYMSLRSPSNNLISKINNRIWFHNRLKKYFLSDSQDWEMILFSGVSKNTIYVLKKYSRNHKTSLIHDSVEWYSPEEFSMGKLDYSYKTNDSMNRKWIEHPMGVIAISSYLEHHFLSRGLKTVRIPVILDMDEIQYQKSVDPAKIVFTYAGSPGRKDFLDVIVKGFTCISSSAPYELRLVGVTKEQLVSKCGVNVADIEKLGCNLVCLGRVPRERVLGELSRTDFTVLMRSEVQRYAKAGFPTKFVESLATATPMISNATSDIATYLHDGENGFLVSKCSPEAFACAIDKALALSYNERLKMQKEARLVAVECFDYRKYTDVLKEMIE